MSTITNELGYAEYDYATRAYGEGVVTQADGLQFRAKISNTDPKGLQAQFEISEDVATGQQFQAKITRSELSGLQFLSQTVGEATPALQFEALVTTSQQAGLQFEHKRTEQAAVGLQFQHERSETENAGLQFRSEVTTNNTSGVQMFAAKGWPHYQCGPGYAEEFGYAMWDYLKPRICVAGGLQALFGVSTRSENGLQWQQKINEAVTLGQQFQAKINETLPVGLQFASRREESQIEGLQFQHKRSEGETYGFQFQHKRFETHPAGMQFESVSSLSTGLQVRVAIYNATNLRVLKDFPSRGTNGVNWTADSTAASSTNSFSVNNLNTDIVEQVWRNAGGVSATLTCDTQQPSGVFVDTVGILNHNLSGGATVIMQYSDNNISWANYVNMTVEPENMYYVAPSLPLQAHRYWRFIITDPGTSFIQIGTIVFGTSIIFQGECFVDSVRFGKKQFADKVFTEGHTNISNDRGKKRFLNLDFRDLNYGKANFRQLKTIFEDAGTILKCLWIPTPKTPSRFAVFAKLNEIPEEEHNTKGDDYVSLAVSLDESL